MGWKSSWSSAPLQIILDELLNNSCICIYKLQNVSISLTIFRLGLCCGIPQFFFLILSYISLSLEFFSIFNICSFKKNYSKKYISCFMEGCWNYLFIMPLLLYRLKAISIRNYHRDRQDCPLGMKWKKKLENKLVMYVNLLMCLCFWQLHS